MQIRKKTLMILCITTIALMITLSIISSFVMLKDYADIDESVAFKNVERVTNSLSNEITTLELYTHDWAAWDDSYTFIEDQNQQYADSNLVDETFVDSQLNLILFVNASGAIVYGRVFDPNTMSEVPVSSDILQHVTPSSPLIRKQDPMETTSGIISLPEGPMLIVSCPIITSRNEGPPRGSLLMGRFLDNEKVSRIGEIMALSLTALPVDDPLVPPEVSENLRDKTKGESTFVLPVSDTTLAAYRVINDIYGNPSFVMQVEMPRTVFQHGQTSTLNFILIMLGVCLFSGILTLFVLEKFVLIPLGTLNASVDAIRQGTDPEGRVWAVGDDELSGLGSSINQLLEALDQSRKELEQSEQRYRAVVEDQTEAIARFQPDGICTFANDAFCRLIKKSPADVIGTIFHLNPGKEDAARIDAAMRALTPENPVRTVDNRTVTEDEQVHWIHWTLRGIFDPAGILTECQIVGSDITGRVRMEDQLRAAHRRVLDIVEFLPDATFVVDKSGHVIAWNRAVERMTGVEKYSILGKGNFAYAVPFWGTPRPILIDLIRTPDAEIERLYETLERQGDSLFSETFVPNLRNGKGAYIRALASPLYDENGDIVGAIESVRDITEEKVAQQSLRESEERFRATFNSQQTGVVIVDPETHTITDANQLALSLFGGSREEVLGHVCHSFICPAEAGKCPVTDLGTKVESSERILLTKKGERIPVIKSVAHITIAGHPFLIESFVDIRRQKQTEEALRRAHDKLALLASVTRHDILNQITAVRGYMDLVKESVDATSASFLEKAGGVTYKMQELLEFTRDYQNTGIKEPEWHKVEEVFRKALATIDTKGVMVKSSLEGLEIYADPLLEKVYYNLVDNTLRHGNRVTEITVSWTKEGTDAILIYADNGVGVSSAEKEIIFKQGYGKNTGFGLFLIREILSMTGIDIRETGEPGKGVRFEMRIPEGKYRIR